jgi:ketosteroid isomerase-like protein
MKILKLVIVSFVFCCLAFAQGKDLQKLVDTENSFAKYADDNGVDKAFKAFLAPDGIVFKPNATNGLEFYKNKISSNEVLSWQPKFADISMNYGIGYTTGDWQYSKEKSESPSSFGQYVSIWQKQQNGEYRVILDIGISHEKPKTLDMQVKFGETGSEKPTRFASFISDESVYDRSQFVSMYDNIYKNHFADDVRVLRDGKLPIIGKKNALNILKKDVSLKHFPKLRFSFGIADFAYGFGTYESPTENGNFVQIWKYRKGKWQIILDVMAKY